MRIKLPMNKPMKYTLFMTALSAALLTGVVALYWQRHETDLQVQAPPQPAKVRLMHRTLDVTDFPTGVSGNQSPSVRGTLAYVLAANGTIDKTLRKEIAASGARVIGPLDKRTLLIEAKIEAFEKLATLSRLAGAQEFLPADKIDARLLSRLESGISAVDVTVLSLAPADKEALLKFIAGRGGEVLQGCLNAQDSLTVRMEPELVNTLARRGDVRWLEAFTRPQLLNDVAVSPRGMNIRTVWDSHGLTGKGQVISTSDSGVDTGNLNTMHRDLASRICGMGVIKGCFAYDFNGHGTHTAGSMVGDGTMSNGEIRGTAPGAKLWAWFCLNKDGFLYMPPSCDELFRPGQEQYPAFIHSASWGGDPDGTYTLLCAAIDDYIWHHPDFLPVMAAGNEGHDDENNEVIPYSINAPASAKNVLAVGATQNVRKWESKYHPSGLPEVTADYSSRGPCADARIKPDIAAPGSIVLSTRAAGCVYESDKDDYESDKDDYYAHASGTSMATPLTAGAVALIREWLVGEGGYSSTPPSAALMKAIITGGAKGAILPNNDQGWGRVDVGEALFPSNRAVRLIDRIPFAAGTNFTYFVTTTNTAPLDVQLVWLDYKKEAGAATDAPCLVNNLNLRVNALTNSTFACWHGNGGEAADCLNPTESVRIAAAESATYIITVECADIVYDHTEGGAAALYIRGAFDPAAPEPEASELVTLTIQAEAGAAQSAPFPTVGTYHLPKGYEIYFSAPEWAYEYGPGGTPASRHAFENFTGTGDMPAFGLEREFTAVVSNDSAIVWHYTPEATDYRFRKFACLYDFNYDADNFEPEVMCFDYGWIKKDAEFSLHFPKDAPLGDICRQEGWYDTGNYKTYGTFDFRLGDVCSSRTDEEDECMLLLAEDGSMADSVTVTMDEGIDLYFDYYYVNKPAWENLPFWWIMRYLCTCEGEDLTAMGDPDGDGFTNAEEYADETNPVNDGSFRFKIDEFSPGNMTFTASVKGSLIVEHSPSLNGPWTPESTNSSPRTSTVNQVDLKAGTGGFYRVRHESNENLPQP